MTQNDFHERADRIIAPLLNAFRSHCPRTARARLRDLTRLFQDAYALSRADSEAQAKNYLYERFGIEL